MLTGIVAALVSVLVGLAIFLAVRAWLLGPAREAMRARTRDLLWRERERIRAALELGELTHFECCQLRDKLFEINCELEALGVPPKVLR